MAIRIVQTGNNAEQIAALLNESGLFHEVTCNAGSGTVQCFGADGNLRFGLHAFYAAGQEQAELTFRISDTSEIRCGISEVNAATMAVEAVCFCRRGVILSCRKSAVLLTKNNLGENMYVIGSEGEASQQNAVRSLRVYAFGDRVRSTYPVNLSAAYNQRDASTVFVPFVTDPGSSAVQSYAPHAFFLPFYQYGTTGEMVSDTHRYLNFAGCWAISDE